MTNQIYSTATVHTLPIHDHAVDDVYRNVDSAPKIVTQIQAPGHSSQSGIEMFVIEYPQQMSHPAHVTSMV